MNGTEFNMNVQCHHSYFFSYLNLAEKTHSSNQNVIFSFGRSDLHQFRGLPKYKIYLKYIYK